MTKKSISRLLQASLMCCLAVLFTACEDFATEDNPTPSYISINTSNVQLKLGDTFVRKAIVAGTAVVIYSSSNEAVATVDQAGKVTAVSEGTATITALVTGYDAAGRKIYTPEEKSYTVTVVDPVESLTLDQTALSVGIGATKTITATVNPAGYTVMWTSSDESVATVENGVVTGVAEGTATITAKAGGKVKTCAVTVLAAFAANEYNEGSWNSTLEKVEFTRKTAVATPVVLTDQTATTITWEYAWYTVSGNVTLTGTVKLTNDVHLILQDGATLTVNGKIDCNTNGKNLYIYGQNEGDGKLIVTNSNDDGLYGSYSAGKFIEIHGGEITATTQKYALFAKGIKVYGGKITATATGSYPGIYYSSDGFDVYGGEIEATNTNTSAGSALYGISGSPSAHLTVYGGKVKGTGNGVTNGSLYGYAFNCQVMSGTTGIKFYFSDDGTTWDEGTGYASATQVGSDDATKKRYAKAE